MMNVEIGTDCNEEVQNLPGKGRGCIDSTTSPTNYIPVAHDELATAQ